MEKTKMRNGIHTKLCVASVLLWSMTALEASAQEVDYAAGFALGLRDIDFELTATGGEFLTSPAGKVGFNFEETLYTGALWGSLLYDRFYVTGRVDISPSESTDVQMQSDSFPEFDGVRSSDLDRSDYSLTMGFNVWQGLSVFSGYKYTEFNLEANEDSFLLGAKDQNYTEYGLFLGGNYTWQFGQSMSFSLSAAYAFLDVEIRDSNVGQESTIGDISFGNFAFEGSGRGLSFGAQLAAPLTDNWTYNLAVKYQHYESENNTTTLPVILSGEQFDPILVDDIDTDHEDLAISFGGQYLFH